MHFIQVQNNYYTSFFSEKKKVDVQKSSSSAPPMGTPNIELDLMHPFLIIFLATWEGAKVQGESLFCSIQGVFNYFQTKKSVMRLLSIHAKLA